MAAKQLELDECGRVKKCVNCGYEHNYQDKDATYCMNCGYGLINRCTNTERKKFPDSISSVLGIGGDSALLVCGRKLAPNANFCPYCGSESLFYRVTKLQNNEDVPF